MYAARTKSRTLGLRGMGEQAAYITSSGARIVYDPIAPPPGIPASAGGGGYIAPPSQPALQYPDGTYIRHDSGEVDVMQGGYRYHILDAKTGDALGGGYLSPVWLSDASFLAIPFGGTYARQGNQIVVTDINGKLLTIESLGPFTSPPAATPSAAQTSFVPTTSPAAVPPTVSSTTALVPSSVSSLTSLLPSWWPYAAIAAVGWMLLGNKKGRR